MSFDKQYILGLIHGDITTSNILIDNKNSNISLVMIDFGLSFQVTVHIIYLV